MTNTPSEWSNANAMIKDRPRLRIALGLHPQLVDGIRASLDLFESLIIETRYIGEIGLDGSTEYKQHLKEQITTFEFLLATCQRSGGKIMSIHSRSATQKVLDNLRKYPDAGIPVLHWFSGSFDELEKAKSQGCWFSIGPAMFQSAKGRTLVQNIPRDRIITETDGPFARFQGEALFPWNVDIVTNELSKLWNHPMQNVQSLLNENVRRLLSFDI